MKLVHAVTGDLEPETLDSEDVISGAPEASALTVGVDEGSGEECGFWSLTPGVVKDTEVKERSLILAGHGVLEFEDGRKVELKPGAVLVFDGGEKTIWTVDETIFKSYWIQG